MNASQLIKVLEKLRELHGDAPCVIEDAEFLGEHWQVNRVELKAVTAFHESKEVPMNAFVIGSEVSGS